MVNRTHFRVEVEAEDPEGRLCASAEVELLFLQSVEDGLLKLASHHRLGAHHHRTNVVGAVDRDEVEIGGVIIEGEGVYRFYEIRRKSVHRQKFYVSPVDVTSGSGRHELPVVHIGLRMNFVVFGAGAERNEGDFALQLSVHLKDCFD